MKCLCGCGGELPKSERTNTAYFLYGHRKALMEKNGKQSVRAMIHYYTVSKKRKELIKSGKLKKCRCGCGEIIKPLIRKGWNGKQVTFLPAFIPGHQWKRVIVDVDRKYARRNCLVYPAYKVYGKECTICGWGKATCDLHHIRKGNTLRDIIVLCPNCHRMAEEGKIKKEILAFLQKSLIDRYYKEKKKL